MSRYISVNDSELFYYFIELQGNPQEDPLFLWLTGGPGCSCLSGFLYEIGIFFNTYLSLTPLTFDTVYSSTSYIILSTNHEDENQTNMAK